MWFYNLDGLLLVKHVAFKLLLHRNYGLVITWIAFSALHHGEKIVVHCISHVVIVQVTMDFDWLSNIDLLHIEHGFDSVGMYYWVGLYSDGKSKSIV